MIFPRQIFFQYVLLGLHYFTWKVSKGIDAFYMWWIEKAMAPHSNTLAWKIPWTEEPGRLQSMGSQESDMTERLPFHFSLSCIGEGNGNPLQCYCLENPKDRGAWWAAVYGVAWSRTWLKRLSSSSSIHFSLAVFKIFSLSLYNSTLMCLGMDLFYKSMHLK